MIDGSSKLAKEMPFSPFRDAVDASGYAKGVVSSSVALDDLSQAAVLVNLRADQLPRRSQKPQAALLKEQITYASAPSVITSGSLGTQVPAHSVRNAVMAGMMGLLLPWAVVLARALWGETGELKWATGANVEEPRDLPGEG